MAASCPAGETFNTKGCSTSECCDDASDCDPNVFGPCVCFSYGDPSPSQSGWNYSFIADCNGNSVSTVHGTACYTIGDAPYAYVCYCRPRESGDVGNVGDTLQGNWIFDTNDQCRFFSAGSSAATSTVTSVIPSSTSGSGHSSRSWHVENTVELLFFPLILLIHYLRSW